MNQRLRQLRDMLHERADLNHDGKLNRQDVEQVVSRVQNTIIEEEQKRPLGTALLLLAVGFVAGGCFVGLVNLFR